MIDLEWSAIATIYIIIFLLGVANLIYSQSCKYPDWDCLRLAESINWILLCLLLTGWSYPIIYNKVKKWKIKKSDTS